MKKLATVLLVLVCAATGLVRWLDVVNFTDMNTGFVTWGSHLWRYALAGAVLLLLILGCRMAAKQPKALMGKNVAQGVMSFVCGIAFAVLGGVYLAHYSSLSRFQLVLGVLYLLTGVWLLVLGKSRFTEEFESPSRSALFGVAGTLSMYLLTIQRFGLAPTGIVRVNYTMEGLAALLVLLFFTAQLKVSYVPGGKSGRAIFWLGMSAFLFATCLALPGVVCAYWVGQYGLIELIEGIALALAGVMGAVYACTAVGPEAENE